MNVHEVTALLPHRFGQVRSVEAIQVGLSGAEVHGVSTDTGDYVLRTSPILDRGLWARELVVRRLTSDSGIAPALEWVDEDRGVTLSQRIGGRGFVSALADATERARALGSLARTLARMHTLPCDGLVVADPAAFARRTWRVQSGRAGFPAWAAPALAHVERAERLLAGDTRLTPSHNDLNPANVLWDGERVWLVDWEQSGLTHPYYDMAALSTFLVIDDDVAVQLVTVQEGVTLSAEQVALFLALRRLAMVFYGTIFFTLAPKLEMHVPSAIDEVASMGELYALIGSGALSLRTPEGQARFGAAMLKRALIGG
jgi:aminoglycoside phosphotransferase (APT) family kinase protein